MLYSGRIIISRGHEEGGRLHNKGAFVCFFSPSPFPTSLLDATRVQPSLFMVDRELEPVPEGIICHHQGSVFYQPTDTHDGDIRAAVALLILCLSVLNVNIDQRGSIFRQPQFTD
ncbi:unnamed protein product [Ectocarpus sp. 4 AP-2014]